MESTPKWYEGAVWEGPEGQLEACKPPSATLPSQEATRSLPACRSWFPGPQVLIRKPGLWVHIPKDRQQRVYKLDPYK